MTCDDGNPYPDGTPILVRYPCTEAEQQADREQWPYLPGTIEQRVGEDEWQVIVQDRAVAELEDGTAPPDATPDENLWHPVVYRDRSEIKQALCSGRIHAERPSPGR
jgi:hypothetical protein